jgi:hypothetical protein
MATFNAATAGRASFERMIAYPTTRLDQASRMATHMDEANGDRDVGDVLHSDLVRTVEDPVAGEVREDRGRSGDWSAPLTVDRLQMPI